MTEQEIQERVAEIERRMVFGFSERGDEQGNDMRFLLEQLESSRADTRRLDAMQAAGFVAGPVDHTGDYTWKWDASTATRSLREVVDASVSEAVAG